jgi:hypothetical protein
VWLAFVLKLTISHHPKAKTFCTVSFLARKKEACHLASVFFFFARKIAKQQVLPQDDDKLYRKRII